MGIFRRRRAAASTGATERSEIDKAEALTEAQRAIASLRRSAEGLERYRDGKQAEPATRMTINQRIGAGG